MNKTSDLVVVDRNAMLRLMDAVIVSLDSSQSLDMVASKSNLDPPAVTQRRDDVSRVRTELITGVRALRASIEKLPSVKLS